MTTANSEARAAGTTQSALAAEQVRRGGVRAGGADRKRKRHEHWSGYVHKVLESSTGLGISKRAMAVSTTAVQDILERLTEASRSLLQAKKKKKTLQEGGTKGSHDAQAAARLVLSEAGTLAADAMSSASTYVAKFDGLPKGKKSGKKNAKGRALPERLHDRLGLKFPVGRIRKYLKEANVADRVGKGAAVYFAAILEYLVKTLFKQAFLYASGSKRHRLTPRYLLLAVKEHEGLDAIFGHSTISYGGVLPNHIPAALLTKKQEKAQTAAAATRFHGAGQTGAHTGGKGKAHTGGKGKGGGKHPSGKSPRVPPCKTAATTVCSAGVCKKKKS